MQDVFAKRADTLPGELMRLLPREVVREIARTGIEGIEEIRFYTNRYTVLRKNGKNHSTGLILSQEETDRLLYAMCGGSVYAHTNTICQGFLSLAGDIRVGICGHAAVEGNSLRGISQISGLIVRLPTETHVSALPLLSSLAKHPGEGILVFAPPGVGKTTLLRAAAKDAALPASGLRVAVVDCRGEFGASLSDPMLNLCLLSGYPKAQGIEIALCTLSPDLIICDEIGSPQDAEAILEGTNAGVPILCSAHGGDLHALLHRPGILRLHRAHAFGSYARLRRGADGTARIELFTHRDADALIKGEVT